MDEPFVGLDPKAVFDVKNLMNEMIKEGKTIFFSNYRNTNKTEPHRPFWRCGSISTNFTKNL